MLPSEILQRTDEETHMDRPLLLPDHPTRRSALPTLLQHLHGTYVNTTPPVKIVTYAHDGNTLCSGPKIGPLFGHLVQFNEPPDLRLQIHGNYLHRFL